MEIERFVDFDYMEKEEQENLGGTWKLKIWRFGGFWFSKKFGIRKLGFGFWGVEDWEFWIIGFWGKLQFCT